MRERCLCGGIIVNFNNSEQEVTAFVRKHFEVLKELDSGTFGQVHKVKHQLDNQLYAIKRIDLKGNKFLNNY